MQRTGYLALGTSAVIFLGACAPHPTMPEDPAGDEAAGASRPAFHAGVFLGDEQTTPERVRSAIYEFSSLVGSAPAWVKSFHDLDADLSATGWAGRVLSEVAATGATNYVALDLNWRARPAGRLLDAVRNGAADEPLARTARALAALGTPVLLEPAWEMNGDWELAWQGVANGRDEGAPARFVASWRRMVHIFNANGATNVRWVFNPNAGNALAVGSPGPAHWNWWGNYYPGDAYVDYVGAHGFNGPSVWGHAPNSFDDIFFGRDSDNVLRDMALRHPSKPIIVGELATEASHDKGEWIGAAYAAMQRNPSVAGAVWFHMDKEADWRINSSAAALAAYRAAMRHGAVASTYRESAADAAGMIAAAAAAPVHLANGH